MSTIFHKGRKVLRQAIGNHNYAEIADLLYFRIIGSKYYDEEGKPFFLLPNINHIVEETGFCERLCQRALAELEKNNWIEKIKTRCFDGAVRIKIYITEKFIEIMHYIESMINNKTDVHVLEIAEKALIDDDYAPLAESDSANLAESYIKEKNTKEEIKKFNNNQASKTLEKEKPEIVKPINFEFSLDLNKHTEAMELFLRDTAEKEQINADSLLVTLVDLQESGLYQNQAIMVQDAIQILQRINGKKDHLPEGDNKLKPKKATFKAEDKRMRYLTPLQQVALIQNLKELEETKKTRLGSIEEVFSWVEFQLTNPDHHFYGKGFKHCLNIIKKILCNKGKRQYSKPYGYGKIFNNTGKNKEKTLQNVLKFRWQTL